MTNPDVAPAAAGWRLPDTSLIVCSRNRPAMLPETVDSILQGVAVPTELIIIDQSDVEHPTLPRLATDRPCDLRYLWERTAGLSRANNRGIAAARFDLLVFTHDDVTVPPDWFAAIVAAAVQAGPRAVVTGQVRPGAAPSPEGFAPSTKVDEAPAVYTGRLD
jgi:O-antigen biosynthesis protein